MKRKKNMLRLLTLLLALGAFVTARSQNFSYTMAKDSGSYIALTNQTVISSGSSWLNNTNKVGLPFEFNLGGILSDTLLIETNGFIRLKNSASFSLVAFNEFSNRKSNDQNYQGELSYTVEGASANRVVKLQFKNLSKSVYSTSDNLSYQVWFFENGNKVEIHIGPHSFLPSEEITNPLLLGLINPKMDSSPIAYLIEGSIHSSTGRVVNAGEDLIYLNDLPLEGNVFRFTPLF